MSLQTCEVKGCQRMAMDWHHCAPKERFPNPDDWPVHRYCRTHHQEWHNRMSGGTAKGDGDFMLRQKIHIACSLFMAENEVQAALNAGVIPMYAMSLAITRAWQAVDRAAVEDSRLDRLESELWGATASQLLPERLRVDDDMGVPEIMTRYCKVMGGRLIYTAIEAARGAQGGWDG